MEIEVGRIYQGNNQKEGKPIKVKADDCVDFKANERWIEYNCLSKEEKEINIPQF